MRTKKRTKEKTEIKGETAKHKYLVNREQEREIRAVLNGYDYRVKDTQNIQELLRQYKW